MFGLWPGTGVSGSCRASGLASSGHMPVQDVPACADYASGLPRARCMGGKQRPLHSLMERLTIDVLTECATLTGASCIMRITWDEAWGVMERAVRKGVGTQAIEAREVSGRGQEGIPQRARLRELGLRSCRQQRGVRG